MKTINQKLLLFLVAWMLFGISCKKEIEPTIAPSETTITGKEGQGHLQQTKTFSADVVRSWLNMQLTMFKIPLPAGTGTAGTDRAQAYSGLALYEAVVPGMPAYQSLYGQLGTGYPMMPSTEPGKAYHWGASANAALAEISRRLFTTTAAANITAMNNLEAQWQTAYATQVDAATIQRSVAFGRAVATRIANWAATDGSANVNPPYIPPVGLGLWVPTNPAAAIVNPYASQRRLVVPESDDNTSLQPLPAFSTSTTSAYYAMVKELHDASLVLSNDQKAMADYFKDNPGYGPGGGFVWILMEALRLSNVKLDQAALAYAKVGMAQNDATIVLFTNKYVFNVMRPVTYIKTYIDPAWNTYIPTPNHPEFPSGHATSNGAVLEMMRHSFGENFPMTLRVYDYLGYPARSYTTFTQISNEMADSRFYGGLHYKETCEKSLVQGKKVAQNILDNVQFLKE
jgi:hypothetical protein